MALPIFSRSVLKEAYKAYSVFENALNDTINQCTYDAGYQKWTELVSAYDDVLAVVPTDLREIKEYCYNGGRGIDMLLLEVWEFVDNLPTFTD